MRQQTWQTRPWPPLPWRSFAPYRSICPSPLPSLAAALRGEGALSAMHMMTHGIYHVPSQQHCFYDSDVCC